MFESHQKGTFKLKFDNGHEISVIWKGGSYSANHDDMSDLTGADWRKPCVSPSAEAYVTLDPSDKAVRFLEQHYGGNPAGYLSVNDVLDICNYMRTLN